MYQEGVVERFCLFISIAMIFPAQIVGHKQIVQISIPKAGTYLLSKGVNLLTDRRMAVLDDIITFNKAKYYHLPVNDLEILTSLSETEFWVTHLFYTQEYAAFLHKKDCVKFFIYRDPRDQVVSFAFYMLANLQAWPRAATMSFDELLLDIITNGSTFDNHPPAKGVAQLYKAYLPWLHEKDVLSIRFEDLVGPRGGGSAHAQLATIYKIGQRLGLDLTFTQYDEIAHKLFGGTGTFREGKIGAWKKYFKKEHREVFKRMAGDILIQLGYEQDLSW